MDHPFDAYIKVLYRYRRFVAFGAYAAIAYVAYTAAFLLRFEFALPREYFNVYIITLPILVVVRAICSYSMGLVSGRWRFAGTQDVLRLVLASTLGTLVFALLVYGVGFVPNPPRSVVAFEWVMSIFLTAGVWVVYRTLVEQLRHFRSGGQDKPKRILIVGAGESASMLCREMTRYPTGYRPVGLVDDDPTKANVMMYGLRVLGRIDDLPHLVKTHDVEEIAIAIPSASVEDLRRIVHLCESTNLGFKVLPGIAEVLAGNINVTQLRDLRIEDLLGREPISLEQPELLENLAGRSVLITGAAGSIGAELARQVALHAPGVLILFDQAETALFYLERELVETYPNVQFRFIVGDIVDQVAVDKVFRDCSPTRVFHAAAYKHVSMMQINAREALRNNVLGTMRVAEAAGRFETEQFILVSTDKAVRPTSVMGATKRLAEMVTMDMQKRYPDTHFAAVRFGNVLGSSGSVIPLFREQIEAGKPLTVTHPEVTRYFMTIPEAVQLILQASILPEVGGSIAMLEMGEPVRIVDLALNLLRLSGTPPGKGRQVVFTGLRDGEKLHEELVAPDETTLPTRISKLRLVAPSKLTLCDVTQCMDEWEQSFQAGQESLVMMSLVNIFPSLERQVARPQQPIAVSS